MYENEHAWHNQFSKQITIPIDEEEFSAEEIQQQLTDKRHELICSNMLNKQGIIFYGFIFGATRNRK